MASGDVQKDKKFHFRELDKNSASLKNNEVQDSLMKWYENVRLSQALNYQYHSLHSSAQILPAMPGSWPAARRGAAERAFRHSLVFWKIV